LQRTEDLALAAARRPDEHHAVPHDGHLVELDALELEDLRVLQPALFDDVVEVGLELLVRGDGLLDAGEEVLDDGAEEDDVVAQELGRLESRMARSICRSSCMSGWFFLRMPAAMMTVFTARMPKS